MPRPKKPVSVIVDKGPYGYDDHIDVAYELPWKKDVIKPGTIIRFKGVRGRFKFRCMAHNTKLDKTWIDCIDAGTLEYRAFYIDKLIGVVKPKRSRRHKANT